MIAFRTGLFSQGLSTYHLTRTRPGRFFCFGGRGKGYCGNIATLKIEPGTDGRLWVSLTRFRDEGLARLKKIPGHRWNPERKQWQFHDTSATRAALAEIVALQPALRSKILAVKPKLDNAPTRKP